MFGETTLVSISGEVIISNFPHNHVRKGQLLVNFPYFHFYVLSVDVADEFITFDSFRAISCSTIHLVSFILSWSKLQLDSEPIQNTSHVGIS